MTRKTTSIFLNLTLAVLAVSLVGCKSPGRNPAGVYGDDIGGIYDGSIPLGSDRFSGGVEYPGMFDSVLFAYDSSQVASTERGKVEAVASHLRQNPAHNVIIEGHCDERGSREYNLALGERRALAVRTYLISLGIASDRTMTKSFGEENPAMPGHDESAWRQNRRSEFVLYY